MRFSKIAAFLLEIRNGKAKKIKGYLEKAGYSCTIQIKEEKTVLRAIVRFFELLYELGLTQQKDHKLPIHIKIDINPPPGWVGKKTIVDIHLPILLQHYDLSSMFAAKLAAVLTRPYTKGRDVYDIFWFRSKWKDVENDVSPYLESRDDLLNFTQNNLLLLLSR